MGLNSVLGIQDVISRTVCLAFLLAWFSISTTFGDGPGWLQICSENKTFLIEAGGCPRGVWLKKPIQVNCVCVNGVWALSKGGCDDSPFLLVGRGNEDCFAVNSEIDSFKYIGKPSDPFEPADFVGTNFLSVFWQLPTGKGSKDHKGLNGSVAMISINSDNVVEARGQLCCRRGLPGNSKAVGLCLSESGKFYKAQAWCSTGTPQVPFTFELDYGEGIRLIESNSSEAVKDRAWDSSKVIRVSRTCIGSCGSKSPQLKTDCCKSLDFEDIDEETAVDMKKIDDQTGRIASRFFQWKLWKKVGHRVEHPEYIYVKTSHKILGKLCPDKTMSSFLLGAMMNLFQFLLTETMDRYPFVKHFEPRRHKRTVLALQRCLIHAKADKPMELQWSRKGVCPVKVETITVYKNKRPARFSSSQMPSNQTFQYLNYDVPLESIWKVMSFTHYYCAKHFRKNPSDHSELMISLESFFNPELLKRWANPGKSYPVMKRLFNMYELPRFTLALDACVLGAKMTSDYKNWVKRPLLRRFGPPTGTGTLSQVFGNAGYCLESYWDAQRTPEGKNVGVKTHPISHASCYPANDFYQT